MHKELIPHLTLPLSHQDPFADSFNGRAEGKESCKRRRKDLLPGGKTPLQLNMKY